MFGRVQGEIPAQNDDRIHQLGRQRADNHAYGYHNGDREFILAREPLQHWSMKSGAIGFALPFSRAYVKAELLGPYRKVLLVPCAAGGTGFSTTPGWGPKGTLSSDAIARANYVLAMVPGSEVKAILWHQGEADHGTHTMESYLAAVTELIIRFRTEIGTGDRVIPFILGQLVPSGVLRMHRSAAALQNAIDQLPLVLEGTAVVKNTGLSSNGGEFGTNDCNHYSGVAQVELGSRYLDAFLHISSQLLHVKVANRENFIAF
jgi:hypothetical protein